MTAHPLDGLHDIVGDGETACLDTFHIRGTCAVRHGTAKYRLEMGKGALDPSVRIEGNKALVSTM